jgi:Glycosyl hydrolases family 16
MLTGRSLGALRRGRAVLVVAFGISALATGATLLADSAETRPRATPPSARQSGTPAGGQPFVDNFNGPAGRRPDPSRWTDYGPGCGAFGGFGLIRCGSMERLDGRGHLVIPATPSTGAGVQTRGLYGVIYGTLSAWIKIPSQAGYWPAFWTLNGSQTGDEARTGEIDIAEAYTPDRGTHADAHVWVGSREVSSAPDLRVGLDIDLTQGFHKYTVEIAPGKLTFLLDDRQVRVIRRSPQRAWAWGPVVTRPNVLILDLARGPFRGASKPARMLVDRVEVRPSGPAVDP